MAKHRYFFRDFKCKDCGFENDAEVRFVHGGYDFPTELMFANPDEMYCPECGGEMIDL